MEEVTFEQGRISTRTVRRVLKAKGIQPVVWPWMFWSLGFFSVALFSLIILLMWCYTMASFDQSWSVLFYCPGQTWLLKLSFHWLHFFFFFFFFFFSHLQPKNFFGWPTLILPPGARDSHHEWPQGHITLLSPPKTLPCNFITAGVILRFHIVFHSSVNAQRKCNTLNSLSIYPSGGVRALADLRFLSEEEGRV